MAKKQKRTNSILMERSWAFKKMRQVLHENKVSTQQKLRVLIAEFCKIVDKPVPPASERWQFMVDYFNNEGKHIKYKRKAKVNRAVYPSFYDTQEWNDLRRKVLQMYGITCMKCGARNCEMHVDHIKPRSLYPALELDPMNLQVLCRSCNKEKGNKHCTDYRTDEHLHTLYLTFYKRD